MAQGTVADQPPAQLGATFDEFADSYEEACHRGLSLTGESRDYFAKSRVQLTARWCRPGITAGKILDFGCGVGSATPLLKVAFPEASLVGIDNSTQSIERARARYGGLAQFKSALEPSDAATCDGAYCNGVFHHIPPTERPAAVRDVFRALRPGGWFALWENNPWNPGTRIVMSRIPFDRDAILLAPGETRRLLKSAGFSISQTTFHFYFPSLLSRLRPLEAILTRVPFGGQYCVLARKP